MQKCLMSEGVCSCVLLLELEPTGAASPHFFWLLLPLPAVLLSCSVHPLAVADVNFVTASDESLLGEVPFENIQLQSYRLYLYYM